MAEKSTKNGRYAVKDIESLRAKINREYLIRLHLNNGKSILVGFTKFTTMVGEVHAEHYAKKALNSKQESPRFVRGGADGYQYLPCGRGHHGAIASARS